MELSDRIADVCQVIVKNFSPQKVILYNIKTSAVGELRSFKLCVIVADGETLTIEKRIYLEVDSDIPFDVLVYTSEEWEKLITQKNSFACRIIKEGTYIHG